MLDDRTSINHSSESQPRSSQFRDVIILRDKACIVTRDSHAKVLEAAHIVPHSKGDEVGLMNVPSSEVTLSLRVHCQYMDILSQWRAPGLDQHIGQIDDPRNGLLLQVTLHRESGSRDPDGAFYRASL